MEDKQYTVYHIHSDYSLLDSTTDFNEYIEMAKKYGQKALASSEHGNVFNWISKKEACDKAGIKYIHACEVYLTAQLAPKVRDNYHTVLIAKNMDGVRELNSLVSRSNDDEHFYFKPRITFSEFLNISDNIISTSACLASPLNRIDGELENLNRELLQIRTEIDELKTTYASYDVNLEAPELDLSEFSTSVANILKNASERLKMLSKRQIEITERIANLEEYYPKVITKYTYYEIQPHIKSKEQKAFNKKLFELSKKNNIPLIAGTDTHSLNTYKAECRLVLQEAKGIEFSGEDEFDLTYKSYDELVQMFKEQDALPERVYLEAIENTNRMADQCENLVLDKEFKYPKVYDDDVGVIKERLNKMLKEKVEKGIIPKEQEQTFINNIKTELGVFEKINMCGFMLFMSDLITWCHKHDIPTGISRGSCFVGDTLVFTAKGYRFIKNIRLGDMVYTHTGELHKVTGLQQFATNEPLYQINYGDENGICAVRPIICTSDHKFLVKRDNFVVWLQAQYIKLTDKLYIPKIGTKEEGTWVEITEIKIYEPQETTVYDITVEKDHSFIVNDVAVHNCGGSCVAYVLDIIDLNPVQWKTVFSRFANENRKELGDIDIDFAPNDRETVYNHMIEEFGQDYTAYILALGTVSDKGCIDEIGRYLHKRYPDESTYTIEGLKTVKQKYDSFKEGVSDELSTLNKQKKSKEITDEEYREKWNKLFKPIVKKYPKIFYYFIGMLDTKISQSMHPCGMVVSPVTLADNYGTLKREGKTILQIDMDDVHDVNLVKYDILGLKNVEIIKDTCIYAGLNYPKSYEVNWKDQDVWKDILKCPQGIDKLFMYPLTVMLSKRTWLTR